MRTVEVPRPDEGRHDGLAFALYRPAGEPRGAVVILHGADSSMDSHLGFARGCAASGLAALCFDARGHGRSGGTMDARAIEDVATMAAFLQDRAQAPSVGLRGSSMGGFLALAAARDAGAAAVVAICPASADGMARGLRAGRFGFAADVPALAERLAGVDLSAAARALGPALLLQHAEGDDVVPVDHSRALHEAAPGSRLTVVPGGHHRSVQHDPELQAQAVRFLVRRQAAER